MSGQLHFQYGVNKINTIKILNSYQKYKNRPFLAKVHQAILQPRQGSECATSAALGKPDESMAKFGDNDAVG